MSDLLSTAAVGVKKGEDAKTILNAYTATPELALVQTATVTKQPQGTGAGDHLIKPN